MNHFWAGVMPVEHSSEWGIYAPLFARSLLDSDKSAPDFLTSAAGHNDARRYAVYKNNVVVSLVRVMESNFPATVRLVGHQFFVDLARVFIKECPPQTRIMAHYGAAFPAFLEAFEPLAAYPYLGDVARIEQAWREAFHEQDADILDAHDLSKVAPDAIASLVFTAHPATRLLKSNYAAGSIFAANRSDGAGIINDPSVSEYALVSRPQFECALRILRPAQGAFVAALIEGKPLGAAVQIAQEMSATFDLTANIAGILEAGAFCEFSVS